MIYNSISAAIGGETTIKEPNIDDKMAATHLEVGLLKERMANLETKFHGQALNLRRIIGREKNIEGSQKAFMEQTTNLQETLQSQP